MRRNTTPAGFALLALVAATMTIAPLAGAQTNFIGGLHFHTGLPQGEMEDQIDDEAYGIGGQFFYAPSTSPLAIGIDLSWAEYGSQTRQEPFSSSVPDVTVDVENTNNIVQGFLVLRGHVARGPIRPYADGLVGFNYLYTETSVQDEDWGEEVASTTNQDDSAFAYGFGGGVMVPVWQSRPMSGGVQQVVLDFGVRYTRGAEAEYLKEGSIRIVDGRMQFDTIESETDMTKVHFGVMVGF